MAVQCVVVSQGRLSSLLLTCCGSYSARGKRAGPPAVEILQGHSSGICNFLVSQTFSWGGCLEYLLALGGPTGEGLCFNKQRHRSTLEHFVINGHRPFASGKVAGKKSKDRRIGAGNESEVTVSDCHMRNCQPVLSLVAFWLE